MSPRTGPRIGVTRWEDVPGEAVERYWGRLREAGAEVVDLREDTAARIGEIAPTLDALMLTGGVDVDPGRYGAARHPKVQETHPARDEMEIAYLQAALRRELPVLAICRGHQLLNVALGGTLLQHVESGEHRADYHAEGFPSRWHDVRIEDGSILAATLGATRFVINSRHHQAVRAEDLAPGLRPVAFAEDHGADLIEGVVSERHRWVVGVQWHPERLEEHRPDFAPRMRPLFEAFVREARAVRA
ncbi:MAG: gamma-glutamyl-gamma-aminobutyrate hydrolase family protein [Chloroflexota bacterium]|nr:gamma-glutamyl-gamma-aminobutyrate hydrolase family protein [Chloroflexota bacterium]